jgi:ABC-type multidrug transport system fused ATPase/permease subunit
MREKTTILIAHRLSTIRDAGQIIVLNQGQIVEQGSHPELLAADGLYRRMYELQAD